MSKVAALEVTLDVLMCLRSQAGEQPPLRPLASCGNWNRPNYFKLSCSLDLVPKPLCCPEPLQLLPLLFSTRDTPPERNDPATVSRTTAPLTETPYC